MFKRAGILKEFGIENFRVTEEVAKNPSLGVHAPLRSWRPDVFCLRIDADEYTPESFKAYYPVFKKYKKAITIFFNVNSFKNAKEEITKCRDMGIDVQSHAFYHYTYNDYQSNRYNISKAKKFFKNLKIKSEGFAAPLGRWNIALSQALEDEGYKYSSEFSYDYMGYPSYPSNGKRKSKVMQIPVFPVAPELFYQKPQPNAFKIERFYKNAIDELVKCNIPAIIYAHTNPNMPEIPALLDKVCEYALEHKKLEPVSMTQFYCICKEMLDNNVPQNNTIKSGYIPSVDFLGHVATRGFTNTIKDALKNIVDFERVTPIDELRCGALKKVTKKTLRKILG